MILPRSVTRAPKKVGNLAEENAALKERSSRLKSELDAERANEDDLRTALKDEGKRGRRLFRLTLVAGVAYVLGTKAGRGRYEQIMGWVKSMRDRVTGSSAGQRVQGLASTATARVKDAASAAGSG